jgi:predicted nucleotidyltransferase
MLTKEKVLSLLQTNRMGIKKFGVKRIGLFGSYARAEQGAKSDIDILVEFEKGQKKFDNYMDLKFFLEKLFNHKVDLVINESIKPSLREPILSGVTYAA